MTRTEDGLEIEVEGKNIELMHMGSDIDVDVDVMHVKDGVTIISSDAIDEETRARLEEVLKDAGTDGTVMFIDGSELSGDEQAQRKREVRVIKKEFDVTN
jgi:23S rRNA U2552 (ribose-2'-O)-methylase RlmE/FtsJ